MIKRKAIAICLLFTATSFVTAAEGPKKAREALASARATKEADQKLKAYLGLKDDAVTDEADVRAVYDEFGNLESDFSKKEKARMERASEHLAKVLASCQAPKYRSLIRELVEKENAGLGSGYWGPWAAKSEADLMRETPRYARLQAVLEASGKGGNEEALPALRSMRKKGGQAGKMAETAIGRIGKDEDLDSFVAEIKSNPRSLVSLYGFGRKGFARVSKELTAPTVSAEEKVRLAGALPTSVSHDDLPAAMALLKHPDPRVVSVAARTVANSLTPADDALLRELLKSKDQAVRGPAILSIDRNWDPKYIPDLIEVLRKDPDDGNRSAVAHMLGARKAKAAEVDLRAVAKDDQVPWVREAAQEALNVLSK